MGAGEAQGEVVGLGAGVGEETDLEGLGESAGKSQRVLGQIVVQVTGVCVELGHLLVGGGHNGRVAVADVADIVDQVEITATAVVEEVLALAAHDLEGLASRKC